MRRHLIIMIIALTGALAGVAQSSFDAHFGAYNRQLAARDYTGAARSVAAAAMDCADARNYDGAFKILSNFDKILSERKIYADSLPAPYYYSSKGRYQIYERTGNKVQAEAWLKRMGTYATKAANKEITSDMLFTEAKYYYGAGRNELGDKCIARLIKQYSSSGDYKSAAKAYRDLIAKAVSSNDAVLVERTYEQYMAWSDSIDAVNADSELHKVKEEMAQSEQTIKHKDHTLLARTSLMTIFIVLFVAAVAVLGVVAYFYRRILGKNRRMKKEVEEADSRTAAKSEMLKNMASEMEPALERLPQDDPAVKDIRSYVKRVEEFSQVDASPATVRTDDPSAPVPGEEQVNLETFCSSIANEFRPLLKRGASIQIDGAKGFARFNAEEVRKILETLMDNAVKFTPEGGRVTLAFKKRSATTSQFIVTDSGPGIPESERETLFQAFNASRDISEGDNLGLPISALRAEKIGASLTLDPTVTRGTSFILTIH